MMIERRQFLQTTIGAVTGMAIPSVCHATNTVTEDLPPTWTREYEHLLYASDDFDWLGIPPSWSCVHRGFHPFSPERTVIANRLPSRKNQGAIMRGSLPESRSQSGEDDLDLIVASYLSQIVNRITAFYGVPQLFDDWSTRAVNLYKMGCQWFYKGVGWVSDMQPFSFKDLPVIEQVPVMNELVDWWLFLIPDGIQNTRGIYGGTSHVLIVHVYPSGKPFRVHATIYPVVGAFLFMMKQKYDGHFQELWERVSKMNRDDACLFLNENVFQMIQQQSTKREGNSVHL